MIIPFVPFPLRKAMKEAKIFERAGNVIWKSHPSLKLDLYQAEINIHPKVYSSIVALTTFFYFCVMTPVIFLVSLIAGQPDIVLPLAVGSVFSMFVFNYLLMFPKLMAVRRMKSLESDLLNSLEHILIEIKSGVPLFNSLISVTDGYGEISEEFKTIIMEINAGLSMVKALEKASLRNPSLHFRRAIWQLTNAMKSGSDVSATIESIVNTLTKEQMISIRKYGQELGPYTLMYMLVAVIMPTLGTTFLIILTSFSGLEIPLIIFPMIIVALAVFQYFFMGIVKTKRPMMVK
ncbi:MAG: type II secretion system F family protein [Candidatus Aenigmarchaeota archaeon]|nr:type II secretion system F family protein [Candidatus Aenigmarchaeota archaeon]